MRLPSKRDFFLFFVAGSLCGCSLIYDLSPDQCGSSSDCAAFGEGYVCEEGMCKASDALHGECTTSSDCLDADMTVPRACIELTAGRGSCVPLTTEECPRILPTGGLGENELWRDNLRNPGSIVIGAFGFLPPEGFSIFTRNYDLAFTELTQAVGGVRGTDASTRPLVVVVCNNDYPDQGPILEGMRHLVDDLRVPAVVSALSSGDLQAAFSQTTQSEVNPNVLMVSPLSSTEGVADLPDNDLVWNILPNGGQVARAYGPLLTRTIDYLHSSGRVPAGEVIKVALVHANDQRLLIDINTALPDYLTFNGKSFDENRADGNLEDIQVVSSYQDAAAPVTAQVDRILQFAPHVVIEIGANELFTKIMPAVEGAWETEATTMNQARPFYVLSPYHFQTGGALQQAVTDNARITTDTLTRRMAGVNYASAPDSAMYNAYVDRYANLWTDEMNPIGIENYYDAPWYVISSLAATTYRSKRFTGVQLAEGMFRLQSRSGAQYKDGPDDIGQVIDDLADGKSIYLNGVMGPPNFDATGAREGSGSVWCVTGAAQEVADVLRVDESTGELVGDGFSACNPEF